MNFEEKYGFAPSSESETHGWECTIPEGFEAEIRDGKVIVRKKESEDERIRKDLIQFLLDYPTNLPNGKYSRSDFFAWLEKQKEQKPTPDWMPKFLDELRSMKHHFDYEEHRDIEGQILAIINWIAPTYFDRKGKEQKPAEWSEEDEKMLTGIIERGSSQIPSHEPALREEQMEWLMNRLRSLRPQPHWKPGKEQMEALRSVLPIIKGSGDTVQNILETLYEQLKKL